MKKHIITFGQFKLLLNKGFFNGVNGVIEIPEIEQHQVAKWLRDVHNIHIRIDDFLDNDNSIEWDYEISKIGSELDKEGNYIPLIPYSINDSSRKFKTYEQALEAGLYETLKLIT